MRSLGRRGWVPGLVVLASGLLGCATVEPGPFEGFYRSSAELQARSDEVLEQVRALAESGFRTPSPLDDGLQLSDVILTWDEQGDPTQPYVAAQPLHSLLRDLRRGALSLNSGIVEYARLLSSLADGSGDVEELDELARAANGHLRAARDTLKADLDDDEVAIVATLAASGLVQKLRRDRRRYLRQTMDGAGATVDAFSEHMASTMDLVAGDVKSAYLAWVETQRRAFGKTASDTRKRGVLVDVLERNDRIVLLMETLRSLRQAYRDLAAAHAELRRELDEREILLVAARRLADDVRRLRRLYEELREANGE